MEKPEENAEERDEDHIGCNELRYQRQGKIGTLKEEAGEREEDQRECYEVKCERLKTEKDRETRVEVRRETRNKVMD